MPEQTPAALAEGTPPADTQTREAVLQDLATRAVALMGENPPETLINQVAERMIANGNLVTRMVERRGQTADPATIGDDPVAGTRWARAGFSAGDVEFAHDLLRALQRKNSHVEISEELVNARSAIIETARERSLRWRAPFRNGEDVEGERIRSMTRDMGTDQAGTGDEMIADTIYGSEMWESMRKESRIASLFRAFPMSGPVQTLPVRAAFPKPILAAESQGSGATAYTARDIASNRVSVTARKLLIRSIWPLELEEDSVFPLVPFVREELDAGFAFWMDYVCVQGDTTDAGTGNINSDDADPDNSEPWLAWDGIAHVPLVNLTTNKVDASTALTLAKITNLRSKVYDKTYHLDWGHPNTPSDFVFVADPETADLVGDLDELLFVKNVGAIATAVTGEVLRIGQNPFISSAAFGRAEADGKKSATASNNTLGRILGFNRNGFVLGWRRRPTIKADEIINTDQHEIVMSWRVGFGIHTPTANLNAAEQAALLYNI